MSQLVFIEKGQAVTDSLTVAEVFGKDHDKVLRDIRELDCSTEFSAANFGESTYTNERGRTYPKYIITQDGFTFLVMGYSGKEAARFKEMYIIEFNRMKQQLSTPQLSGAELIAAMANQAVEQERRMKLLETAQQEHTAQLETIKETFLQHDEDWRNKMNTLIKGAAFRMGGNYQELRNRSYNLLEERARCDLDKRLRFLVERLERQGATKTQLKNTTKMTVIEADPKLKEIYTTIVKELSIGTMV
jgi:Rha family phage regulatory protein